ncbi:MAG: ribonuclease Z [Candidatus Micrarchaeota archaeon]|nr:ribonuclease Z [Candidatus Micrarchaeota archaeon]
MRVVFLGTSGSAPTKARNLPAVALEHEGEVLLFDCGEGTQRQAMHHSVNISKISAIFLTHAHGDHIIGIAGLIRTLALNKRTGLLKIYIPEGQEGAVRSLIEFDNALIGYPIQVITIKGGVVHKGDDYTVSAFRVNHTIKCYGFAFAENDKLHFMKQKADALGIRGKMYSELTRKGHAVVNGRRVSLASVTTKERGRKVVYATDTKPCKATKDAAEGANLLIHEATYSERYREQAVERGHATALQVAKMAKAAKVNMLALTHISARYRDPKELLDEARSVFKNTRIAEDGMRIEL